MTRDTNKIIAIYMEAEDDTYDELIIDLYERSYEYLQHLDKRDLLSYGNGKVKEICVQEKLFYEMLDAAQNVCACGREYYEEFTFEQRQFAEKKRLEAEAAKPIIPKEIIWQALRWELSKDEQRKLLSFDVRFEEDDYCDFNLIIDKIRKFMEGCRVSAAYFNGWCIVLMRCFYAIKSENEKLRNIYCEIADYMDGFAFLHLDASDENAQKECKQLIARLKCYNHQIEDIKGNKTTDFEKNGVIVYVAFAFTLHDGHDSAYYVCIVDKINKLINYTVLFNVVFDEEINYTIISEEEFYEVYDTYFEDYKPNASLTVDCQKRNPI